MQDSSHPTFVRRVALKVSGPPRRLGGRLFHLLQRLLVAGLVKLGTRVRWAGEERATVIILSYKRMRNMRRILDNVLLCEFVGHVIVSNNNPDVDITPYIPHRDHRLKVIQHLQRKGPAYRYDVARAHDSDYYICIDDDVFPSPWQLRRMFASFLRAPSRPHGSHGAVYDERLGRFWQRQSLSLFPRNRSLTVDVILHIYFFTKRQLDRYFELVEAIGLQNSEVHSSEDVIISFTGDDRPVYVDTGHIASCPTSNDPQVATWQRDGFNDFRHELFDKLKAVGTC